MAETITVELRVNNKGKVIGAKKAGGKEEKSKKGPDPSTITELVSFVVTKSSPACTWYYIGGTWYKVCR